MIEQEKTLPPWAPGWARNHPWIWSIANALAQGSVFAGLDRFEWDGTVGRAWLFGAIGGTVAFVFARIFVNRPPWEPTWLKRKRFMNLRTQPQWVAFVFPILALIVLASHASQGVIDRRPWEIVWSIEFAGFALWVGYWQWTYGKKVRVAGPPPMSTTDATRPPPAGIWPGLDGGVHRTAAVSGLASPARRLGARVIDLCLIFVAASIIAGTAAGTADDEAFGNALLAAFFGVWTAIEVGMVTVRGQTPGKMIAGIRVSKSDEGDLPGLGRALIRWTSMTILYATLVLGPIASAWLLWDKRRQTLYDKAAGTLVLRVQKSVQPIATPMVQA